MRVLLVGRLEEYPKRAVSSSNGSSDSRELQSPTTEPGAVARDPGGTERYKFSIPYFDWLRGSRATALGSVTRRLKLHQPPAHRK